MRVAVLTGGFDPVTAGHLELFKDAQSKADVVLVYANTDKWLTRKKGKPFMDQEHRIKILEALQYIDAAIAIDEDDDDTSCWAIRDAAYLYPGHEIFFMNGGDRDKDNIPEMQLQDEIEHLTFKFGIGGTKKEYSSSWLLQDWKEDLTKRRWGYYKVLSHEAGCKVKELYLEPDKSISLQMHRHREEHWIIVAGEGMVEVGYKHLRDIYVTAGSSVTVQKHEKHKITNIGTEMLKIVEVQTGEKLVEEDIIRFEEINEE